MFKKLLSNLPFNPSLIQEVSFYAKRLHKEEGLRRAGLVLVALSMFLQMFAAISPAEASVQGSPNDIVYGGFDTHREAVDKCRTIKEFEVILRYYGVSCDSLAKNARPTTILSTDRNRELDSLGHWDYGAYIKGNRTDGYAVKIGANNYYMKNLWAWDSAGPSRYEVLYIVNDRGLPIWIMYSCGNIITEGKYPPPTTTAPAPKPAIADIELATCDVRNRRNRFYGWAFDGDRPSSALTLTLYIDGTKIGTYRTDKTRSDINAFLKISGSHGFDINLSNHSSASDGKKHTAKVTFADINSSGRATGKVISSATKSFGPCTVPAPPPPPPTDACPGDQYPGNQNNTDECRPCEDSTNPEDIEACLEFDKKARNNSQNIEDANGTTASAGDSITYTLSVKNTGKTTAEDYVIEENMGDVMEYVEKINSLDGGKIDDKALISWPAVDIAAGASISKTITVQLKSPIPETPQSTSNPGSFDLLLTNTFHDKTINIKLPGSVAKIVEQTTTTLPKTGPGTTVAVAAGTTVIVGYFFARSRLMAKELDLVREDFASSGGV